MTASSEQVLTSGQPQVRLPDFFIVGHAKCGTTALYETLRAHPQIFMPAVKEPQFFARNPHTPEGNGGVKSFEQTGRHEETLEQYLSLFSAATAREVVGEASTFYLWSHVAAGRIAQMRPDAKIIAILREPSSFLYSLHLQMLQNRSETEKDLRRALALEDARRRGEQIPRDAHWPEALMYSERVRYVQQLRRYHSSFASEQVLVLIYDDFKRDNEQTVRRVLRFLGVDHTVSLDPVRVNPTVAVRSDRLRSLVRAVRLGTGPGSRAVRGATLALTSSRVRRNVLHPLRRRVVYSAPPAPDESLTAELRMRFKGEVVALSEYLGRDLVAEWGYDDVG
jgi:hypothetical protein